MKINYIPTKEEVRKQRKAQYLEKYPITEQLEALTEAMMGNDTKLKEMLNVFSDIRGAISFHKRDEKE